MNKRKLKKQLNKIKFKQYSFPWSVDDMKKAVDSQDWNLPIKNFKRVSTWVELCRENGVGILDE